MIRVWRLNRGPRGSMWGRYPVEPCAGTEINNGKLVERPGEPVADETRKDLQG
jgi:hypothetical protein